MTTGNRRGPALANRPTLSPWSGRGAACPQMTLVLSRTQKPERGSSGDYMAAAAARGWAPVSHVILTR
jgi:hypothetical protein